MPKSKILVLKSDDLGKFYDFNTKILEQVHNPNQEINAQSTHDFDNITTHMNTYMSHNFPYVSDVFTHPLRRLRLPDQFVISRRVRPGVFSWGR